MRSHYQIQGWITSCHWAWPGAVSMRCQRPTGPWPERVTDAEPVFPCWLELPVTAFAYPQPKGASVFYQFFIMFLNVILFDQWPIWSQFTGIFLSMYCTDFNSGHQTKGDDGHLIPQTIVASGNYFALYDALWIESVQVLQFERQGFKST